jgi:hypothetical protein
MNQTFPVSTYPPYGYNDNNLERTSFPGNIYPINGGMTGNPTGRFNGITTNSANNYDNYNFKDNFEENTPIIEKLDYRNKNNLLYNNVGPIVLEESIIEYRIIIDSLDRDIKYYPDPFSFVVNFNPAGPGKMYHEKYGRDCNKIVGTEFKGTPGPTINRYFRNIKYVKLENIILPQFSKTCKNDNNEYEFDRDDDSLIKDRFTQLMIKELDSDRILTTGEDVPRYTCKGKSFIPPKPFAVIIPDKILGQHYYSGTPYYGNKYYRDSLLGNISRLSINFHNSEGEKIKYNHLFNYDEMEQYEYDHCKPLSRCDLRNPWNKHIQTHLSLIFGVCESQIDTDTEFAR